MIKPPEDKTSLEADFRKVMRRVASGVALVTTRDRNGNPHGFAATTANSLSMDPPSMVVCVNRSASAFPVLDDRQAFCVNLLSIDDRAILDHFSQSHGRHLRFDSARWMEGAEQLPYLEGAPACVFCQTDAHLDYGSHRLLAGRIVDIVTNDNAGEPLVWFSSTGCRAVPLGQE